MTQDELPIRKRESLQNALLRGEHVVWLGYPQAPLNCRYSRTIAAISIFTLFFCGFIAIVMYTNGYMGLSAVSGSIAGGSLLLAAVSPWLGRWLFSRLFYVLTDRRALVLVGRKCLCFPRHEDMLYHLVKHKDGSVSLMLGQDAELSTDKKPVYTGFLHLPADEWVTVYELMKQKA